MRNPDVWFQNIPCFFTSLWRGILSLSNATLVVFVTLEGSPGIHLEESVFWSPLVILLSCGFSALFLRRFNYLDLFLLNFELFFKFFEDFPGFSRIFRKFPVSRRLLSCISRYRYLNVTEIKELVDYDALSGDKLGDSITIHHFSLHQAYMVNASGQKPKRQTLIGNGSESWLIFTPALRDRKS